MKPVLVLANAGSCLPGAEGRHPPPVLYHVNPDLPAEDPDRGVEFAAPVFAAEDAQFAALRDLCRDRGLSQRLLNRLFDRVLGGEAYLRQFRVHLPDLDQLFCLEPEINRELFDLFNPFAFRLDIPPLLPPYSAVDVSFTRFVLSLHRLCCEPMSDLIFDFLAACRSNPNLSLTAFVYGFNFQQLILLFTKDAVSGTVSFMQALIV